MFVYMLRFTPVALVMASEELSCETYSTDAYLYSAENTCFWYVGGSFTHMSAGEQCSNMGGHLATPDTNETDQFIIDIVGTCKESWLGVTNNDQVNIWTTWEGRPASWTKWASNMPSDVNNNRCVKYGWRCLWKNKDCSFLNEIGALCEAPANSSTSSVAPTSSTQTTEKRALSTTQSLKTAKMSGTTNQAEQESLQNSTTDTVDTSSLAEGSSPGTSAKQDENVSEHTNEIYTILITTEQTVKIQNKNNDVRPYIPQIYCRRRTMQCRAKNTTPKQISLDEIKMDRKKMTKFLRKFYSAADHRISSKVLGLLGVGVIITVALCLVFLDIVGFIERKHRMKPCVSQSVALHRRQNRVEPARKDE